MPILPFTGPVPLLERVGGPVKLPIELPFKLSGVSDVLFNDGSTSGLLSVPFPEVILVASPAMLLSRVCNSKYR